MPAGVDKTWNIKCQHMYQYIVSSRGVSVFKGSDHIQQVVQITRLCGTPDEDFLQSLEPNSQNFMRTSLGSFDRQDFKAYFIPKIMSRIMRCTKCTEQEALDRINPQAVEFLDCLLKFDPDKLRYKEWLSRRTLR